MGGSHARALVSGEIPDCELTAVCDISEENLNSAKKNLANKNIEFFMDSEEMFKSGKIDAAFIVTPHYDHPLLAISALNHDLHVLIEKPAGVFTKNIYEMNAVAAKKDKIFGIMFNQRTRPIHEKLKEIISSGELGEIKRTNWIMTSWYRSQVYYDAGGWRATWEGEGGGVLLNQCPHQLDLWQWICGMPKRVRAFASFGKYHNIEVEDDVTAYVEYENGATGVFITSTGEAPGSNRFEIVGDMGKIIMEDDKLTFWRNRVSERQFNAETREPFEQPECWKCDIPTTVEGPEHKGIIKNFVDAILKDAPLIAPGIEGVHSLEISNAMLLSSWTDDWVDLPVDPDFYYEKLKEKINSSTFKKKNSKNIQMDVEGTH